MPEPSVQPPPPPPDKRGSRGAAVGDTLRRAYRDTLHEPIPDELLKLLDRLA